jgi:hypothetical protein
MAMEASTRLPIRVMTSRAVTASTRHCFEGDKGVRSICLRR